MREYKLDKSMIIVSETDAKGRVLYANEDLCTVAQFSKDEIMLEIDGADYVAALAMSNPGKE